MYSQSSKSKLLEKVGYELWLLKYIAETQDAFEGDDNLTSVEFDKEHLNKVNVLITIHEHAGMGHAMKVIESISPLTFISCYKIIDMIFEWILEENFREGNIKGVPWQFFKKINIIKKEKLEYPPLMQSEPYLIEYLFSVYDYLTKFRNQLIHKNGFLLLDEKLRIEVIEKGVSHVLEIDKVNMGAFVRLSIAYAKLLIGEIKYSNKEEILIKYNLDRVLAFHRMPQFNQVVPAVVTAIYNVSDRDGYFTINLIRIREKLKQIYPASETVFDLKVIGWRDKKQNNIWEIPVDCIPNTDQLILPSNEFKQYII